MIFLKMPSVILYTFRLTLHSSMVLTATLKLNSFIWNLCLTFTVEPISLPVMSGVYTPYAAGNLAPLLTSVFSLAPDPRTTASCNSDGTSVTVRLSAPLYSEAGTSPVRYETWWNSRVSAVRLLQTEVKRPLQSEYRLV